MRDFLKDCGWIEVLGGLVLMPLLIATMWIGLYLVGCK